MRGCGVAGADWVRGGCGKVRMRGRVCGRVCMGWDTEDEHVAVRGECGGWQP
mgnify:CR=1 FL=1